MRILMLAQFYPPIIGGEERHVRSLSTDLVKRGYDVSVATLWHKGLPETEVDQGVRIHRVRGALQHMEWLYSETGRRHAPPFPDPGVVWTLRNIIAQEQPEIVHAHNWLVHSFLPIKAWSRAKLIMTLHGYSLVCAQMRLMYRGAVCEGPGFFKCLGCAADYYGTLKGIPTALANWVMSVPQRRAVDMFLPVSKAVAAGTRLVGSGLPYRMIPNFVPDDVGIPTGANPPCLSQLPTGDYLLFVGDLTRDKGVDTLLQAYEGLAGKPPLVLIGRPLPTTPAVLPPGVIMLNSWPHHAVMEAMRRSTLVLTPSICPDACPTVVMEAMAAGRPIVGSNIGGIPDLVVDGETGSLVSAGDPASLSQAIQHLLEDPALRERMSRAAKERVIEFYASNVVSRVERVYHEVLQT